jgi:hypothetical protein
MLGLAPKPVSPLSSTPPANSRQRVGSRVLGSGAPTAPTSQGGRRTRKARKTRTKAKKTRGRK